MTNESNARVVVQQWISLDGFASGRADEMDIMSAVDADADARSQDYNQKVLADVTSVLLGRRTYEKFVTYWPTASEPIAARVNEIPKVVASTSIRSAPWSDDHPARVVDDAIAYVRDFRTQESGRLMIWGSLDLTASLLAEELIDTLDLFVAPVWLGDGTRLLEASAPVQLTQLTSENWGSLTHLRYRVDY